MPKGIYQVPFVGNEPVKSYAPGSPERKELLATYKKMYQETIEVPQYIGSEQIFSGKKLPINPPHDHQHVVGHYHKGTQEDVKAAIDAALKARKKWAEMSWEKIGRASCRERV